MRCSRSRIAVLALGALASTLPVACQPVLQPFSHTETGETAPLDLPDSGGVVLLGVKHAPPVVSNGLTMALVEALAARDIPAFTTSGNRRSHYLEGLVLDDGRDAAIVWTLRDPEQNIVDTLRQPIEGTPVADWSSGSAALMRRLAEETAPRVAAFVQSGAAAENVVPPLYVAEVTGAPGSGNRQLRNALRRHLGTAGLTLADGPSGGLTVFGTVSVGPPDAGQQMANLEWRVVDAANAEVGKIAQSNPVVAGSLDGSWGALADAAAQGAAQGITALVRSIDWAGAKIGAAVPANALPSTARAPR